MTQARHEKLIILEGHQVNYLIFHCLACRHCCVAVLLFLSLFFFLANDGLLVKCCSIPFHAKVQLRWKSVVACCKIPVGIEETDGFTL